VRPWRVVVAAVLLVGAVLLAMLALDVNAWSTQLRDDDLRFRVDQRSVPSWTADTILPSRVSRSLLAVDDDRALRQGVAAFRVAYRTGRGLDNGITRQRRRAAAETVLAAVHGSPAYESQAADLVGLLAASGSGTRSLESSVASFQNAVRLDPSNVSAQFNLELLLHLLEAHGKRVGPGSATGPRGGREGAGAGTPGSGY
jgi:hypothetical protein